MKRRSLLSALSATVAIAVVLVGAEEVAPAQARGGIAVEISVIHALRTDAGLSIDPQLRDLPQLTKEQPFVRYNVFKFIDRRQFPVQKAKPVVYGLVDGRTLQVTLVDVVGPSGGARYRVRAEIAGPGKKEFLKLLEVTAGPNEPFFVGGQSYAGGTLFLELAVRV